MDRELVLRAKKRDKDAFVELINQQKESMYKIAKTILKKEDVADDDYFNVEWQEMMSYLNEKQRIVVELYYVEQFKVREIADILQIGQSAVKGRLQAARKIIETNYCTDT